MRAVLTTGHGGYEMLQLRSDYPTPVAGPGEVRVSVAATAVNFHDLFTRRGMPGVRIKLPVVVGSDIAGTVESLGAEVPAVWLGKRVLIDPVMRDTGRVGMVGETTDGGRAEFVIVHHSMLIEIPTAVGFEQAAALPLAYGTAYRMLKTRGKLAKDEKVMVLGASGGVGVACVQIAALAGAEVLAFASSDAKLERLEALGATHAANYSTRPFLDTVKEIYGKPRIDGSGGVNGLFNITVALASRVTVILLPQFKARRYLLAAAEHRCTLLSGIPTMFALMVREHDLVERLDFSAVRDVTIGSAPLTDALLSQVQRLFPNAQIRNGYGTTEAGPAVFGPHPEGRQRPPLSLGYPFADVECALIDGDSASNGTLALRTPALMHGYLNLPQATSSRIRDGWYLTGDVMRRDADGFYFFVGRSDDMFICGGENIYPGEVEKLLERHVDVAQAIVVAAPDDIKGQIPVAFIVPRPGAVASVDAIKQYALREGPAYAHPRFVEFLPSLPVSGTHKIDRAALTVAALRIARSAGRAS